MSRTKITLERYSIEIWWIHYYFRIQRSSYWSSRFELIRMPMSRTRFREFSIIGVQNRYRKGCHDFRRRLLQLRVVRQISRSLTNVAAAASPVIRESAPSACNWNRSVCYSETRKDPRPIHVAMHPAGRQQSQPPYQRAPLVGRLHRKGLESSRDLKPPDATLLPASIPQTPSSKPLHRSHGDQLPLSSRTNERTNERASERANERKNEARNKEREEGTNERANERMNEQTNERTNLQTRPAYLHHQQGCTILSPEGDRWRQVINTSRDVGAHPVTVVRRYILQWVASNITFDQRDFAPVDFISLNSLNRRGSRLWCWSLHADVVSTREINVAEVSFSSYMRFLSD